MAKRLNTLYVIFLFCCIVLPCNAKQVTLLLAADMPDISSPFAGRYAELKSLLDQQREKTPPVFFVFGGGSLGPSAMASFDRGSHIIDILNSLEPDVMTVTKREFSYFEDELSLRALEAAFPFVASNVIDKRFNAPLNELVTSAIIEKQGVKLGVISLLNERVIKEYLLQHVALLDPLTTAKNSARELKEQGADIVLLHYSYPFDFVSSLLDENVIDIAVMSDNRLKEKAQGFTPHKRQLVLDDSGIAVVANLTIDNSNVELESVQSYDLPSLLASPSIQLQANSYQLRLDRLLNEKIGVWKNTITSEHVVVRSEENEFANFITDSMRTYTKSDIAIINGGSIRGNKRYKLNSAITRRDVATELPFRSSLVRISLTGKQLLQGIENGLSQVELLKGAFPHFSGMNVTFDVTQPAGRRVTNVNINGQPLDPNKEYSVATTDYLVRGGDGYTSFQHGKADDGESRTNLLISDLVTQNIRLLGGVSNTLENRIRRIQSQ
ncbi:bifunctional metallophosphatase/5'-nucleotidase [Alteromonas sp. A079]|uniref:bifunctional metallophosphatase/5'-nucleotidase n=1 Tax=Alteromonas sp. A079 TaxID=3410268 RepID=UPI003BA26C52